MLSYFKKDINVKLGKYGQKLHWLNPNIVTLLGIIPPISFTILVNNGSYAWSLLALALHSVDALDGLIARTNNKVTKFGGFLDSTTDRISDSIVIVGLHLGQIANLWSTFLLLILSFLISYTRTRAENYLVGASFTHGLMERAERLVFIGVILLVEIIFPEVYLWGTRISQLLVYILVILCLSTFLQRLYYAKKRLS